MLRLTPMPEVPHYPFIISEVSGGGGDGKSHWACSLIGRGPMAYFHDNQRRGTPELFSAWASKIGSSLDECSFGLAIDSRWSNDQLITAARALLADFFAAHDALLAEQKYMTVIVDSVTGLKDLIFLSEWGNEPPKLFSEKSGKYYPDRMKAYGPVNQQLERLYNTYRNQQTWMDQRTGKSIGTSLVLTSEARQQYTGDGKPTNLYLPHALGKLDFACDVRATVGGPTRGEYTNTITFHKGGMNIAKLGKPAMRREAPESLMYILGVDPADWGRGPNAPPSYAAVSCPMCRKDDLTYEKIEDRWMMVDKPGIPHQCKTDEEK